MTEFKNSTQITVLTLFPEPLAVMLGSSILGRAQKKSLVQVELINPRDFATDKHKSVDAPPFGGGAGMLLRADVLDAALSAELAKVGYIRDRLKVIAPSPRGLPLDQTVLQTVARWCHEPSPTESLEQTAVAADDATTQSSNKRLVLLCGHYEGIDERLIEKWVDLEFSVGDFVLSGAELPALLFIDALVRQLPGVLGNQLSLAEESFSTGLIEYPQYTRPVDFDGRPVPELLRQGHHQKIKQWQLRRSLELTAAFRPDLIQAHSGEGLPPWAQSLLEILKKSSADLTLKAPSS